MAEVLGFTLKRVKKTNGIEGDGFTCDVEYKGKVIASYEDWGTGALPEFYYNIEATDEVKAQLIKAAETIGDKNSDETTFVLDLMELMNLEKSFKRGQKQGYPFLLAGDLDADTLVSANTHTKEQALQLAKQKKLIKYKVYSSLDDFKITE